MDSGNKPYKCCANCDCAMKACEKTIVRQDGVLMEGRNETAVKFNKTRRICGDNYNLPSYNMFEKRSCTKFTPNPHLNEYFVPEGRSYIEKG